MGAVGRTAGRMSRLNLVHVGGCPWSWSRSLPSRLEDLDALGATGVFTFLRWRGGDAGKSGGCSRSIRTTQKFLPLLASSLREACKAYGSWCPCRSLSCCGGLVDLGLDGSRKGEDVRRSAETNNHDRLTLLLYNRHRHSMKQALRSTKVENIVERLPLRVLPGQNPASSVTPSFSLPLCTDMF